MHSIGQGIDVAGAEIKADDGPEIDVVDAKSDHEGGDSTQPSHTVLEATLQKVNTAVLLDNEQYFEAALQAYLEACSLLQFVMMLCSGNEEKPKLDAIVSQLTNK